MRGWFTPPVFNDQEESLRARSLFYLVCVIAVGVTIAMAGMTLAQPELIEVTSWTAAITLVVCLGLLFLVHRRKIRLASVLVILWGIGLISERAIYAGGVRSPGIPMLYVFALIAGFLLGETAGVVTAIACVGIGLLLVGAEYFGFLPAQTLHYKAISYWWLSFMYMCVVVMLVRLAIRALRHAFDSQQRELAERRSAERKLHVALDAGQIGVWEWVPSTGALTWDERMYELYGKEQGSTVDYQDWASTLLPGQLQEQESSLKRTMQEPRRAEREFRIRTPQGARHIFAAEKSFPAQDGEPVKLIGINMDVTKIREAEAEAWALKGQLETLLNKATVGILIHRKFKPLVANPELAAIFGYASLEEMLALPDIRVVLTEQVRERAAENYLARIDGGDPGRVFPVRCQRKDGRWIDVEARSFPIYWNGEPSMCTMITDVTQQRKLEAQLRQAHRLEAVGQLTGGIAHDFNNLLTVILGNADALERMLKGNHPADELAALTRAAAERGSELTSRLLSFSRQQTLNVQPADVEALVTAAHGLIRRTIGDKVQIRIVHGKALWRAFTDAAQMESALLNLAINARDAMPNGGVLTIETSNVGRDDPEIARLAAPDETGKLPPPDDFVLVAVSDTGTGMDEETRSRAFEPFFTTKDVGKGSGLGLSMVYGFVKQLRGLIRIDSELGRGTTVGLYLPRAPQGETSAAEARQAQPMVGGSEKILLVEDNDLVREQCAIQLKRLGYHVLAAEDGEVALAILEKEQGICLLFSDVSLPKGLNGPELAARARLLHPGLPVLLSSGYAGGRIDTGNLGMRVAVLKKPYYQDQLAAVIRDLLA
ncbi:MAG TPA: ATP-binding protein [Rhizomicrobium sp.]|nr:ATP-binding protein [Rhizomicrobium sp.]